MKQPTCPPLTPGSDVRSTFSPKWCFVAQSPTLSFRLSVAIWCSSLVLSVSGFCAHRGNPDRPPEDALEKMLAVSCWEFLGPGAHSNRMADNCGDAVTARMRLICVPEQVSGILIYFSKIAQKCWKSKQSIKIAINKFPT